MYIFTSNFNFLFFFARSKNLFIINLYIYYFWQFWIDFWPFYLFSFILLVVIFYKVKKFLNFKKIIFIKIRKEFLRQTYLSE